MNKTLDILISPTIRCSLCCKYCYVNQTLPANESDMTLNDFHRAFSWVRELGDLCGIERFRFTWFGGEPLLKGPDFLRRALALQKEIFVDQKCVFNVMQTNLTFCDEEVVRLIKESFRGCVGVSDDYDAPWRTFPNGADSRLIVEKNIMRLKENNISVGVVCTLTKSHLGRARELYQHFKKLGVDFRVNRAAGTSSIESYYITVEQYNEFVKKLFDIYLSDPNPTIEVLNFTVMSRLYLGGLPFFCIDGLEEYKYIGIEANGRIMSRCRYAGQLGNYNFDTPLSFLEKCRRIQKGRTSPQRCLKCEFLGKVCLGGCRGESDVDCFNSDCGYRTETTYDLWLYVSKYLSSRGHYFGEFAGSVK